MLLRLEKSAYDLGVINPVSAIISGIFVEKNYAGPLPNAISVEFARIKSNPDAVTGTPQARGFRELFANMGYPELLPAGERLVRSFTERGFKNINNIVDAYNIVSMKHCAGIGMHDANRINSDVVVRRARASEQIVPLFQERSKAITLGDLIYLTHDGPLAWLGKRDVDSDDYKVTDGTKKIFVIVLGNKRTARADNLEIVEDIYHNIKLACPSASLELVATHMTA